MTRSPTPARGTSTTLRALRNALLVGRSGLADDGVGRLVQGEGYLLTTYAGASEALESVRAEEYDLVLVDLGVEGIDAPELIAALRSEPRLENVAVIVVAAGDDVAAIEKCLARGADDFIPPAVGPAMLRSRLSAALNRRGVRDTDNLRREMDVARNIQRDFLPESLPAVRGVQLQAALIPARQVSGDFYDVFQLGAGNLMLVVGDVCDKGVGAALFMALFRSLIRASADPVGGGAIQMIGGRRTLVKQSLESATPGDLLTRVAGFTNNYIARLHGRTNMFATVFMAVLDPVYGGLDYLNAGHEPALIVGGEGGIQELRPTGPALGMMPDSPFAAKSARLESGQSLLLFTDGLVEAHGASGDVFGGERLRDTLRAHRALTAPELVRELVDTLSAFGRGVEPHDDLTMLAATRS